MQTEKVTRRSLTEVVVANGKIQPVVQVTISAEVSGEIIELPVKEGQSVRKGDLLLKIKPDFYVAALNQSKAGYESSLNSRTTAQANLEKAEGRFQTQQRVVQSQADFGIRFYRVQDRPRHRQRATRQFPAPSGHGPRVSRQRGRFVEQNYHRLAARWHGQPVEIAGGRTRARHGAKCGNGNHDHRRPERNGKHAWTSAKWTLS
ncbi:MAG: biotin/lipoyl-binding protein [Limisphaerales bacterium]